LKAATKTLKSLVYQGLSAFFNHQNVTRFCAILCHLRLFKRKNASQMQVKTCDVLRVLNALFALFLFCQSANTYNYIG